VAALRPPHLESNAGSATSGENANNRTPRLRRRAATISEECRGPNSSKRGAGTVSNHAYRGQGGKEQTRKSNKPKEEHRASQTEPVHGGFRWKQRKENKAQESSRDVASKTNQGPPKDEITNQDKTTNETKPNKQRGRGRGGERHCTDPRTTNTQPRNQREGTETRESRKGGDRKAAEAFCKVRVTHSRPVDPRKQNQTEREPPEGRGREIQDKEGSKDHQITTKP